MLNKIYKFLMFLFLLILIGIISLNIFASLYKHSEALIIIKDYEVLDNIVHIKYRLTNKTSNVYCLYTTNSNIDLNNNDIWTLSENNECSYPLDDNKYIVYLKTDKGNMVEFSDSRDIGYINNLKINSEKEYLPLKSTYKLDLLYDKYGYVDEEVIWESSNSDVASVENGVVTALKEGKTTISAKIYDLSVSSEIIVTSLINKRPTNGYDFKKPYLSCERYSEEEATLLDEILKSKIDKAGYKTRAGVVEAARFLTLDFPYRINYFNENGTQKRVDGEGRYFHIGLYLSKSKYKTLTGSSKGPKMWGCSMYSRPVQRYKDNGLDCSGFVSWAILNGGFNTKDAKAGILSGNDLTDYGEVKKLTPSLDTSNQIKVGDLLHNNLSGHHIAIIVGIDNDYYYVAQSIWYDTPGVIISKIKKNDLHNKFLRVVFMDKLYKEDGNLTNMW